jgi:hypothetical protein
MPPVPDNRKRSKDNIIGHHSHVIEIHRHKIRGRALSECFCQKMVSNQAKDFLQPFGLEKIERFRFDDSSGQRRNPVPSEMNRQAARAE